LFSLACPDSRCTGNLSEIFTDFRSDNLLSLIPVLVDNAETAEYECFHCGCTTEPLLVRLPSRQRLLSLMSGPYLLSLSLLQHALGPQYISQGICGRWDISSASLCLIWFHSSVARLSMLVKVCGCCFPSTFRITPILVGLSPRRPRTCLGGVLLPLCCSGSSTYPDTLSPAPFQFQHLSLYLIDFRVLALAINHRRWVIQGRQ